MSAFLRKYATGSGADIHIPIIKRAVVDFALNADWTPAAGDVKISIDGAAAANIATLPTALTMGNTALWKFVFSNGELTGKTMVITISDTATKVIEDQCFIIETYGHASAMYQADLSAANLPANVVQAAGTAWNSGAIGAATLAADTITAAKIAADAITDAKVAADVTIASVTGAVGSVTGAVGSVTGNVGGNVTGSVGSVVGAVGSVTGNVGGNVVGSVGSVVGAVGSIAGVTFPANFSALGINGSGNITRVVLVDTITTYTGNTPQTGDSFARIGALGAGLTALASAANLATLQGNVTTILGTTTKVETMLVLDGAVYQFTVNALELAPGGGGGALSGAQDAALTRIDRTVKGIASKRE